MPSGAVTVQFAAGTARYAATLDMPDYFNIPNAIFRFLDPVSIPASVTFDVRWNGPLTQRLNTSDPTNGFASQAVLGQTTMTWSARRADGFRFVSDPSGTTSFFALLSRERNGIFFDD